MQTLTLAIALFIYCVISKICLIKAERDEINIGILLGEHSEEAKIAVKYVVDRNNANVKNTFIKPIFVENISDKDYFQTKKFLCNVIERAPRMTAILTTEFPKSSPVIQKICERLQIPYIQTNWQLHNSYLDVQETSLNFYPEFKLLSQGLAALAKSLEWKSFAILYENNDGLIRLQEILKLQKHDDKIIRGNIVLKRINSIEDSRAVLKQLKHIGQTRIILDCETDNILHILQHAKNLNLMTSIHNYFLTSLDAHTVDITSLETEANITTVRIINPNGDDFKTLVSNWELNEFRNSRLAKLDPYKTKTETVVIHEVVTSLITAIHDNEIQLNKLAIDKNLSCNNNEIFEFGPTIISSIKSLVSESTTFTGIPKFDMFGRREKFTLYMVENIRDKVIASWDSEHPLSVNMIRTEEESYKELIQSLQRGTKIVATRLLEPYFMMNAEGKYTGYVVDLMDEIAKILEFKYEFLVESSIGAGIDNTSSWEGILGAIMDQRAMFGLGDITITPSRERVVDFSLPFMRLGIGVLYKKTAQEVSMFAFLEAFTFEVWMYTSTLYLTVSIILYIVARMAPGDWENPHPCDLKPTEVENIWNIKNCLWVTLASIMNQGSDILPKGITSRLVASMWYLFALVMTNTYTASLAAFLTNKEEEIDDIEDLAQQNKIQYGTLKDGSTEEFFNEPSVFVRTNSEGITRVLNTRNGLYAFLMESTNIEYITERNCELRSVGKWLINKEYGIAMPLDCPYRSTINDAILTLQEKGTLLELKEKWWKLENPGQPCEVAASGAKLGLANVGGLFLLLSVGLAVGLLLGIFEFLWNVRKKSVGEHISYWEAFKIEFVFSLKVWIPNKKCKPKISESPSSESRKDEVIFN